MTPEEKEAARLDLIEYITGTLDEWMRLAHFGQTETEHQGTQYRIAWEHVTAGAMIANVKESQYSEPIVRFGVQIDVETLPDLPPIGPENDLGIYGIDESEPPLDSCRCPTWDCEHSRRNVEASYRTEVLKQEWVPATLVQCLAGDRIRIGTDETDVIRTDGGRVWHADNTDPYRPKPWKHVELRMELAANPGFQEYPPNTPCEILCAPERKASLAFQSAFPGSAVTSSDVD